MPHWIFHILIYLLLGAVTTVVVAWACVYREFDESVSMWTQPLDAGLVVPREASDTAFIRSLFAQLWEPTQQSLFGPTNDLEDGLEVVVLQRSGLALRQYCVEVHWLEQPIVFRDIDSHHGEDHWRCAYILAAGWPLGALSARRVPFAHRFEQVLLWPTDTPGSPLDDSDVVPLPLRPVFPGFLINTLLYAAIWFGMSCGVGAARRVLRRRRGRCLKCGYDLRGNLAQGCPECGWARERAE